MSLFVTFLKYRNLLWGFGFWLNDLNLFIALFATHPSLEDVEKHILSLKHLQCLLFLREILMKPFTHFIRHDDQEALMCVQIENAA